MVIFKCVSGDTGFDGYHINCVESDGYHIKYLEIISQNKTIKLIQKLSQNFEKLLQIWLCHSYLDAVW